MKKRHFSMILVLIYLCTVLVTQIQCSTLSLKPVDSPSTVVREYSNAINDLDFDTAKEYLDTKTKRSLFSITSSITGITKSIVSSLTGFSLDFDNLISLIGPLYKMYNAVSKFSGQPMPSFELKIINLEEEPLETLQRESTVFAEYEVNISNIPDENGNTSGQNIRIPLKIRYSLKVQGLKWKIYKQDILNQTELQELFQQLTQQ